MSAREGEEVNGDEYHDEGDDLVDDESDEEDLDIVRQDSSFSKLSADSWLKVESEYDGDEDGAEDDDEGSKRGNVEGEDYFWNDIALRLREKPPAERSVLECLVELLSGTGASKKARFRFGDKRIWFNPDIRSVKWTSKKKGVDHGKVILAQVRSVKASGERRSILIETADKKRIALSMPNSQDLFLWIRCLSCFASLQSQVVCHGISYSTSEREDYDLSLDSWDKKPLRNLVQLNDYYILDTADTPTSRAMLVLSRGDKHFYGLKCLQPSLSSAISVEELSVIKKLNHPNLLRFKEFLKCKDRDGLYALFEYIPRGLVIAGYKLENNKPIPEETARKLMNDVAAGLMYLHAHRIAHGDIRLDNLLIAADGSVKINPLGAIMYDYSTRRKSLTFTNSSTSPNAFAFAAPELCRDAKRVPKPAADDYDADTWSLGALLYFMVYGRAPFLGDSAQSIQEQITTAKVSFPETPKVSKRMKELMRRILGEKDPRRRIKLDEVVRHPALTETSGSVPGFGFMKMFGKSDMVRKKVPISSEDVEAARGNGKFYDPSKEDY